MLSILLIFINTDVKKSPNASFPNVPFSTPIIKQASPNNSSLILDSKNLDYNPSLTTPVNNSSSPNTDTDRSLISPSPGLAYA